MKKSPWWRERWALGGAVASHVVFLLVAERLPPRVETGWSAPAESATEADIVPLDVTEEPESAAGISRDRGATSVEPGAIAHGAAAQPSSHGAAEVPVEGADGATTAPTGPSGQGLPAPGSADEYGEPESTAAAPLTILGMPGIFGNVGDFAGPAAPTKTQRAAPVADDAAERVIASSMLARDKRIGVSIPAAGVVQGAVSAAMREAPVAHNTRATVRVELSPDGKVSSARVVSASGGDAATWDRMAKSIASSLAKQKLAMGAHGTKTGAVITVTATQKHVFPSGTTKAADVKPVCANAVLNEIVAANDKDMKAPSAEGKVPIFVDENGLPCIPVGFGGVADLANLGAQKQIQVQTSVSVALAGELELPEVVRNVDTSWVPPTDKSAPRPNLPAKLRKRLSDKEKKR